MRIAILSFTPIGNTVSRKIATLTAKSDVVVSVDFASVTEADDWCWTMWHKADILIFVGVMETAQRVFSSHIMSEETDPAVIVIDDNKNFLIPVIGCDNEKIAFVTQDIADSLGSLMVRTQSKADITFFDIDAWAAKNYLKIDNQEQKELINSVLQQGKPIGFSSAFPVIGPFPKKFVKDTDVEARVCVCREAPLLGTDEYNFSTLYMTPDLSNEFVVSALATFSFCLRFDRDPFSLDIVCGEYS